MKTFLAIFTCAENSPAHEAWKALSPEAQKERFEKGLSEKKAWHTKYAQQIINEGFALGDTTKSVDKKGIQDIPSRLGQFMVIKATSHEEAAKMFLGHPHFVMFPGDGVEILEQVTHR